MPKSTRLLAAVVAAAFTLCPVFSRAAVDDKPADKSAEKPAEKPAQEVTTQGALDAGGQHILYNAVAGTITVGATDAEDAQLGTDGKPLPDTDLAATVGAAKDATEAPAEARMFYVAYFKRDAKPEQRPITFLYNGGPGSSTVWLHMGSFGPKHVETDSDTHLPGAPYKLVDNANSLLDVSDLVFIDMPGTGFGRLTGKDAGKSFWGIDEDATRVCAVHCAVSVEVQPLEFAQVHLWRKLWDDAFRSALEHAGERQGHRPEWRDSPVADFQFHDGHRWSARESGDRPDL